MKNYRSPSILGKIKAELNSGRRGMHDRKQQQQYRFNTEL